MQGQSLEEMCHVCPFIACSSYESGTVLGAEITGIKGVVLALKMLMGRWGPLHNGETGTLPKEAGLSSLHSDPRVS